jgi:hypothetical protein
VNFNKVLASLCYFSIFPIVVYFVADDQAVKQHAKKAFLSHLIPAATIFVFIVSAIFAGLTGGGSDVSFWVGSGLVWIGFAIAGSCQLGRCSLEYYQRDSSVEIKIMGGARPWKRKNAY